MKRCLYCYQPLAEGEQDFHAACSRKFFGTRSVPTLEYTAAQLDTLAENIIRQQTSLTGVQPKLSLHLASHEGCQRLTIVGLWGDYICKPQAACNQQMPEVEDVTMHLAELAHIAVVPHSLMRMADGSLCYLSHRIDRTPDGEKLAMEDMCQITERQTEQKYKSSYERIAKAIVQYSSVPRLDVANFFEVVLFCWFTGNNDMHLKNFSLIERKTLQVELAPAYDLLNAALLNPSDNEELALTLNAKKRTIRKSDFLAAAQSMGLEVRFVEKLMQKYIRLVPKFCQFIDVSFLSEEYKHLYCNMLHERALRLQGEV